MRFDGFTGNTRLQRRLCDIEENGRMPHAFIFEGADEKARHALALLLAQWVVCTASGDKPGGVCAACVKAKKAGHPDVFSAQGGAGSRSFHVDVIRTIREDAYILPNEAQRKVYLLEGADTMTEQAQNALLKILEEPPAYVLFILTCVSSAGLLPTVRSRAQIFTLEPSALPEADTAQKQVEELTGLLAGAVAAPHEYELLAVSGKLIKDKDRLRAVLQRLALVFRDACVCSAGSGGETTGQVKQLCARFTAGSLLSMLEATQQAQRMLEQNANQTLLVTWLCAKLRMK